MTSSCVLYEEHSCTHLGCREVLVLDGNLKKRGEVCMAKDAGYIEFAGIPEMMRTGCSCTLSYKCRFCPEHINHACMLQPETQQESRIEGMSVLELIQ